MKRTYRRLNRRINYAPGEDPRDYPDHVTMEYREAEIDERTFTVAVLGGTVTAEALDSYMTALGGWVRVAT